MEKKPKIYVAHTLGIRDNVEKEYFPILNKYFTVIDPFESRRALFRGKNEEEIREMIKDIETSSWPVSHDIRDINQCDVLLMINTAGPSYGSIFEVAHAHQIMDIPCIAIVKKEYLWHPWLNDYCITVTDDFDIAMFSLHTYFGFEYKRDEDE